MNKLLFIRLVFIILMSGPVLCLASPSSAADSLHQVADPDSSVKHAINLANKKTGSLHTLESSIGFAVHSLFSNVCCTVASTFELVISILSQVFLSTGTELANNVSK